MADVFLLLAALAVVVVGVALVTLRRLVTLEQRRRALASKEKWLASDEYISRVNAAKTADDLRRAQEGK